MTTSTSTFPAYPAETVQCLAENTPCHRPTSKTRPSWCDFTATITVKNIIRADQDGTNESCMAVST